MTTTAPATVAATSPLSVYMDGDQTNKVPAVSLGATLTVGDRVRVEVRGHGLLPVVQGKVS